MGCCLHFQSNHSGIEILWIKGFLSDVVSSNRTIVELKYLSGDYSEEENQPSNRTIVELKFETLNKIR